MPEYLKGLKAGMDKLNKEIEKIEGRTYSGLVLGALLVRGKAQEKTPLVTGNLRSSAYVVANTDVKSKGAQLKAGGTGKGRVGPTKERAAIEEAISRSKSRVQGEPSPSAEVGFGASYAPFVHENPYAGAVALNQKKIMYPPYKNSKRARFSEVGEWKFLETAVTENIGRIKDIIVAKAKKG